MNNEPGPKPLQQNDKETMSVVRLAVVTAAIHGLTASPSIASSLVNGDEKDRDLAQRRTCEAAWGIAAKIETLFNGGSLGNGA